MLSRATSILLAFLLIAAAVVYWTSSRDIAAPMAVPEDAVPPGRWSRVPKPPPGGDDLAAVLSLPYVAGKIEAGETSGVVAYDRTRAWDGLNLYCSGHAPEAVLMDMRGRVLHRWSFAFGDAFPELRPSQETAFFRRVALLPGGGLVALFQGKGLIELDRDSRLLWARAIPVFNDLWVEPDGSLLVLTKRARVIPDINPREAVLEDFVVTLDPEGRETGRLSLLDLFRQPPWDELLDPMSERGDILHSNTVTRLSGRAPEPEFADGNLLVSLRQVDVVGVVDPGRRRVVWARRGPWHRQHEPVVLADGHLLVFDNQGRSDGARILELDPASGEIVWSYGEAPGQEIFSPEGGAVARLPNGNTLVTASEGGRAIEVDPSGEIVWEFVSPHRAGPDDSLVAALWEVQRIDPQRAVWLDHAGR